MKRWLKWLLILAVLGGGLAFAGRSLQAYFQKRNRPQFLTADTDHGPIVVYVNATGKVKPEISVEIGTFVSGPIIALHAECNEEVQQGQLLAEIDPKIYQAAVDRDQAQLDTRKAEVARVEAELQRARNDEKRSLKLREENKDFISQAEIDQFRFNRAALEAALLVAQASVTQADASLQNSLASLGYTKISSPVDGIVVERRIEPGQTLAAQFQTPVLFSIAPRMREKMLVFASVDEADIGRIRDAEARELPASFTVDAYPDELFQGTIDQVRYSSTETQNVVTYPVVVAAANAELKLLPGMTANISFEVDRREDVVRIPNAALRFFPPPHLVRDEDKGLVEGTTNADDEQKDEEQLAPAAERTAARRRRAKRHVWVAEQERLRAIEVEVGIGDYQFTELVAGELPPGTTLVTGLK